jgi:cyclase
VILPRIIPILLLQGKGLVKGVKFKDHTYVGDPVNAVQIFNSKEVDEIIFLDINATRENRIPDLGLIQSIADQCLLPFAVGGGIKTLDDAKAILANGAEKVCICSAAIERPELISEISGNFGIQSVVVSVDVKKTWMGKYMIYSHCGTKSHKIDLVEYVQNLEKRGTGEILLNCIDRDGTREGFDLDLFKTISEKLSVPLIGAGGAGSNEHLKQALSTGNCSAVAAGSLFVHFGKRKAVLINYPDQNELMEIINHT